MNVEVAANKRFLDTTASQSAHDWDELLTSQVDLSIASELSMLLRFDGWMGARTVIDAGCGNGHYLAELKSFFPEKHYLGVDVSPELIATAAHRHVDIDFVEADFFALDADPADAVIMRFLVQHLGDFGSILKQARRLLAPGGSLVIIEADLARSLVWPLPATFYRMLDTYGRVSTADGGLKARLLGDVEGLIADTGEAWHVSATRECATPLVGPFAGHPLEVVFGKWVDLAERSAMFAFDFPAVRAELKRWANEPKSVVNLVTRMFVLEPEA